MESSSASDVARSNRRTAAQGGSSYLVEEDAAEVDLQRIVSREITEEGEGITLVVEITVYAITPLLQAPKLSVQLRLERHQIEA